MKDFIWRENFPHFEFQQYPFEYKKNFNLYLQKREAATSSSSARRFNSGSSQAEADSATRPEAIFVCSFHIRTSPYNEPMAQM